MLLWCGVLWVLGKMVANGDVICVAAAAAAATDNRKFFESKKDSAGETKRQTNSRNYQYRCLFYSTFKCFFVVDNDIQMFRDLISYCYFNKFPSIV